MVVASHGAALVVSKAEPSPMPTPNSASVPHGIEPCVSSQFITPTLGRNIRVIAAIVVTAAIGITLFVLGVRQLVDDGVPVAAAERTT